MEISRTLTKAVDLGLLHTQLLAQIPGFTGLCASDGQPGDVLRILGRNLTVAAVDAVLAAHVPPSADDRKTERAVLEADSALIRAVTRAVLDEIDGRHQANPVDRPAFRQRVITYLKALL